MEESTFLTPGADKSKKSRRNEFRDSPFVMPPSPFMKRLGYGTQVSVYRYNRQKLNGGPSSPWAIKKARRGRAGLSIITRLTNEGEILRKLCHPNIVMFKKLTRTDNGDVCLSMEACGKGLCDIICKQQDEEKLFPARHIIKMAWCVASALNYLHTEMKLLHGDIKSGNVLVKGVFDEVKVCDFGVSIFLNDDLNGAKNPKDDYIGSEPWCSKEIINEGKITDKADIFAYGLVIWEMLALDVPFTHLIIENDSLNSSFAGDDSVLPQEYYDALGTQPPLPYNEYSAEYNPAIGTFVCCTNEDYTKRPSAASIVDSLSSIISEYGITSLSDEKKEVINIDQTDK